MNVAVLGGGAWGTVLAGLAAQHGHGVALWEIDAQAARELGEQRASARSVPGFRLPEAVEVMTDLPGAVGGCGLVVLAVPSETVRATLTAARAGLAPDVVVACASKGLEPASKKIM